MVRLIHMIKKGLKRVPASPDELSSEISPSTERPIADFDEPPQGENPYRKKAGDAAVTAETRACLERYNGLEDLYRELYAAARFTLSGSLHREKITGVVEKVVDVFTARPYNELMQMFYTFSRQHYLAAHIANDVVLTVAFAQSLGYERRDVVDLGIAALTHDLGMSSFDVIARKSQALTPQEIEDIKRHPLLAAEMVRPVFSEKIAAIVTDIHERENGQGYPRGIPGAEIHIGSKIIGICDTFEALTHPRVFRAPYSPYEAMKIIIKKKNIFFDDVIVRRFIDLMSIYPVGTLVGLNTGETGLVVASNKGSPTRPVVQVVINETREVEELSRRIDLDRQHFVYITGVVEPDKEKEILYFLKPRGQVALDET